jgi:hypothetical protein
MTETDPISTEYRILLAGMFAEAEARGLRNPERRVHRHRQQGGGSRRLHRAPQRVPGAGSDRAAAETQTGRLRIAEGGIDRWTRGVPVPARSGRLWP